MDGRPVADLRVRLLGAPEFERAGKPVRFDTRKAVALLAYLAVTGRPHTRDELAALLWPESDRVKARSALRRTLSAASAVGPALVSERATVTIDPAVVDSDVSTFLAGRDGGVEAARAAVVAYRGELLEGFTLRDSAEFEEWRAGVQDRLRRDLDRMLSRLVDDHLSRAELVPALDLARRRVALDPLNEPAHQSLIALYDWNGQRSDALQQYRRCVRVLDRELGVAPLPETTAVYDAVRRRTLAALEGAGLPTPPRRGPEDLLPERPPGPVRPFVGRTEELAALEAAWQEASGSGRSAAVVGEVGSGKSALLAALAARVEAGAGKPLVVGGHEGEQSLAYGATGDLLRALVRTDPGLPGRLSAADRAALTTLVPSWGEALTGDHQAGVVDRGRLFDAVRTTLELLGAGAGPVLLVVEDVHWLDAESRDLVAYLVRRPMPGVLVVATWRGSASPSGVAVAVSEALADGRGIMLRLGALTAAEVGDVLSAYGHPLDGALVDEVLVRTGGLPLLVAERAMLDVPGGEAWGGLDTLVQARIDAAPETTRQVVSAVAVVAMPVSPDLLRAVSGRGDAEVVGALEDAIARGLLVELPGRAEYDIPHETLRRLATEATSLARRRLLHSRAADALSPSATGRAERGPGWSGSVARHLELAGRREEAAAWHVRAAEDAAAVFAHASAEAHLEAALALGHPPLACHLGLGDARLRLGRYAEAIESYEQAAALAATDGDLVAIEHRLAAVRRRLGEPLVAQQHLEAALALVDDDAAVGPPSRAMLLADLALVALDLGRPDDARADAEAAVAVAGPDGSALAQAYNVVGVVEARAGELERARTCLLASLEHARGLQDPGPAVAALNNLARVEAEAGELVLALDWAAQALDLGSELGDTHRTAALHANLADLLHEAGRDEEAHEHQRHAAMLFAAVDREPERRPEIWKLVEW